MSAAGMASDAAAFTQPSFVSEQLSPADMGSAILAPDSPLPSELYEDAENPDAAFTSSSPIPWPQSAYDESHEPTSPLPFTQHSAYADAASPAVSPLLAHSASADSQFTALAPTLLPLPPQRHSTLPLPALPFVAPLPTTFNLGGITMPLPHSLVYGPDAFPLAPLPRGSTTLDVDSDSSDDGEVEVVGVKRRHRLTLQEKREQSRRRRLEQQTVSSALPTPQPVTAEHIDAEAEATADVVDLTSDSHPLLSPTKPLPPPPEPAAESPPPPVSKHQCPICLGAAEELASLKCGHVFCLDCLTTTVNLQHKCPTCRQKAGKRDIRRLYM